jgi:hypothetical protein
MPRQERLARRVRALVFAVVAFVLLAPVGALGWGIFESSFVGDLAESDQDVRDLVSRYAGVTAEPMNVLEEPIDSDQLFCVTVEVQRIEPAELQVAALVSVTAPDALRQTVAADVQGGVYAKTDHFKVFFEDRLALGDTTLQVPVGALLDFDMSGVNCPQSVPDSAWSQAVVLPVVGQPRAYPSDRYLVDQYVHMEGPSVDGISPLISCCPPVDVSVASAAQGTHGRVALSADSTDWFVPVALELTRSTDAVLYSYELTAVPAALLLLLVVHMHRARRRDAVVRPQEIVVGVAAVPLSIIPLRQVLIPADIPGLTVLDVLFGLEIVLLVLVAFWYTFFTRPSPERPGSTFRDRPAEQPRSRDNPSEHWPSEWL